MALLHNRRPIHLTNYEVMNTLSIKQSLSTLIAAAAVVALGASVGTAQAHEQDPPAGQPNSEWSKAQSQEFFRASDLTGKTIQDNKGQKIGDVKYIVFNKQGEIFALTDIGNDRLAVVPWQVVNIPSAKGNQNLVINTTDKHVHSGPAVTKNQWSALDNPNFIQGVYSYYHIKSPTAQGGASSPGGTAQEKGSSDQEQHGSTEQPSSQK